MPRHPRNVAIEYAVLPGLEAIATQELTELFGAEMRVTMPRPGMLRATHATLRDAMRARTVGVAYMRRRFDVPRPRSLLERRPLGAVVEQIRHVIDLNQPGAFGSLRISAAGSESPVFRRLAAALEAETGLRSEPHDGDLVVRVVPDRERGGWDVAVRLTPRPLSARAWRQPGFAGALEATVAAAMVRLTRPRRRDAFVDLCCGSATLLTERLLTSPARLAVGIDCDRTALRAASSNLVAARVNRRASLVRGDASDLAIRSGSIDALCANPPWGHQMGSHISNAELYPAILSEAARVAVSGARFSLVSHEVRLVSRLLDAHPTWRLAETHQVSLRGHHPPIWLLRRA